MGKTIIRSGLTLHAANLGLRGIANCEPEGLGKIAESWLKLPQDKNLPLTTINLAFAGLNESMIGITIEHAQIIDWTQSRGGHPAINRVSAELVTPIISFTTEANQRAVSWEEWMSVFDKDEWAFIYQDRTPEGELSQMWEIIPRFGSGTSLAA